MSSARTERLLNLLTLLLNTRRPIALRELRTMEEFQAYCSTDPKTGERAFERDKAALVELGVPLRWVSPDDTDDEEGTGGYLVDRERYYLPDLDLKPAELAVLSMAGAAAQAIEGFPGGKALRRALGKLGFDVEEAGSLPGFAHAPWRLGTDIARVSGYLELLHDAVARRCQVDMQYQGWGGSVSNRRVDPYGLYYRQGNWYLYAYCQFRQDSRTFHLGRIVRLEPVVSQTRTGYFELPENLDLQRVAETRPWQYPMHPPIEVQIKVAARLVPAIGELFGSGGEVCQLPDGDARLILRVSHRQALIEAVLPYGVATEVMEPDDLRAELGNIYRKLALVYGVENAAQQGMHSHDSE